MACPDAVVASKIDNLCNHKPGSWRDSGSDSFKSRSDELMFYRKYQMP